MEGNNLKATTISDGRPRRSRTKSLLCTLAATALLFGAVHAFAPASTTATVKKVDIGKLKGE